MTFSCFDITLTLYLKGIIVLKILDHITMIFFTIGKCLLLSFNLEMCLLFNLMLLYFTKFCLSFLFGNIEKRIASGSK